MEKIKLDYGFDFHFHDSMPVKLLLFTQFDVRLGLTMSWGLSVTSNSLLLGHCLCIIMSSANSWRIVTLKYGESQKLCVSRLN